MSDIMDEFMDEDFDFAEYCKSKKEKKKAKTTTIVKKTLPRELPKMMMELEQMKNSSIELKENVDGGAAAGGGEERTIYMYHELRSHRLPNNMLITLGAPISHKYMYDLLKKICVDEDTLKYKDYYIVNYDAYKKMLHYKYDADFLARVRTYYVSYKQQFADIDKLTYNYFILVLSHICKSNEIEFSFLRVKYFKGKVTMKEYKSVREYIVSRRLEGVVY